jgi:hypothetical protein
MGGGESHRGPASGPKSDGEGANRVIDSVVVRALNDVRFRREMEVHPAWVCRRYGLTSEELAALKQLISRASAS